MLLDPGRLGRHAFDGPAVEPQDDLVALGGDHEVGLLV